MQIIKSTGEKQLFNAQKLARSLRRTGASPKAVIQTLKDVKKAVRPNATTDQLFQIARRQLYRYQPDAAIRYSLARALQDLGPTGFPFEQYIAKVLQAYGYATSTNQTIRGRCVSHEVDVVARKDGVAHFIECKYHRFRAAVSDLKVALYHHARCLDLKEALQYWQDEKAGWLITNTRCTSQAIAYAECVGMRITAWHYPQNGGLEQLIEANELYPITIFPVLDQDAKQRLIKNNFLLAKDVLSRKAGLQKTGIPAKLRQRLVEQAEILLS